MYVCFIQSVRHSFRPYFTKNKESHTKYCLIPTLGGAITTTTKKFTTRITFIATYCMYTCTRNFLGKLVLEKDNRKTRINNRKMR